MLRSAASGTMRVHQRLNAGRAMPLCWTANTGQQRQVDAERPPSGRSGAAIEAGRGEEAADEADGVDEHSQEDGVAEDAVEKVNDAGQRLLLHCGRIAGDWRPTRGGRASGISPSFPRQPLGFAGAQQAARVGGMHRASAGWGRSEAARIAPTWCSTVLGEVPRRSRDPVLGKPLRQEASTCVLARRESSGIVASSRARPGRDAPQPPLTRICRRSLRAAGRGAQAVEQRQAPRAGPPRRRRERDRLLVRTAHVRARPRPPRASGR